MHLSSLLMAITVTIAPVTLASAQESRFDLVQPEHKLLERFAGEWQFERLGAPGQESHPPVLGAGTISAEMIGNFFVVSRWSGTLYGADYTAVQSLGYDIQQKQYAGTWMDSFMGFRWELTGAVDQESREFTLTTRGPAPTGGTTAFRERYQFHSADSITISGEMQRGEAWVALSTTRLTRKR